MSGLNALLDDWQNEEELDDQIREGFRQSRSDRWIADNCQVSVAYVTQLRQQTA